VEALEALEALAEGTDGHRGGRPAVEGRGHGAGHGFGGASRDPRHFFGGGYTSRAKVAEIQQIHHPRATSRSACVLALLAEPAITPRTMAHTTAQAML